MFEPRFKSYFITRLKLLKDLSWVLEWWVLVCESVLGDLKALCFRECNDWVLFNPNQSNPRGHSEENKISWVADEKSKFKCTSSVKGGLTQWPRSYWFHFWIRMVEKGEQVFWFHQCNVKWKLSNFRLLWTQKT